MTTALQIAPVIISVPADTDLSTKQFKFMNVNSSGELVVATAGGRVAGVLTNDPDAAGKPGDLQIAGVAKVLAGGSITAGDSVAADASGDAVTATGTANVAGIALTGAADDEYVAVLLTGASAVGLGAMYETVTSGALNLGIGISELSVTGTQAYTLAAPTYAGQKKTVRCKVAASTPAGTLTVSSPDDTTGFVCPAKFFFDNVGQLLVFEATAALKWRCIEKVRVGVKELVIGTTVTTDIANMSHLNVSVTATVASTGTKALPNGAAVGELLSIGCTTAASTPHGDIDGTFIKKDGTAGTRLDDFAATTDYVVCAWTGAAWQALHIDSATITVA